MRVRRKRLPHGPNWRARLLQAADAIRHARKARDAVDLIDFDHGEGTGYTSAEARIRLRQALANAIDWAELAVLNLKALRSEEPPP